MYTECTCLMVINEKFGQIRKVCRLVLFKCTACKRWQASQAVMPIQMVACITWHMPFVFQVWRHGVFIKEYSKGSPWLLSQMEENGFMLPAVWQTMRKRGSTINGTNVKDWLGRLRYSLPLQKDNKHVPWGFLWVVSLKIVPCISWCVHGLLQGLFNQIWVTQCT